MHNEGDRMVDATDKAEGTKIAADDRPETKGTELDTQVPELSAEQLAELERQKAEAEAENQRIRDYIWPPGAVEYRPPPVDKRPPDGFVPPHPPLPGQPVPQAVPVSPAPEAPAPKLSRATIRREAQDTLERIGQIEAKLPAIDEPYRSVIAQQAQLCRRLAGFCVQLTEEQPSVVKRGVRSVVSYLSSAFKLDEE